MQTDTNTSLRHRLTSVPMRFNRSALSSTLDGADSPSAAVPLTPDGDNLLLASDGTARRIDGMEKALVAIGATKSSTVNTRWRWFIMVVMMMQCSSCGSC